MPEHFAALSVGSNLGDRLSAIKRAVAKLSSRGARVTAKSRVWETKPWGVSEQPLFLNACVTVVTEMFPHELLRFLKATEEELGRTRAGRWGPREIDMDIIFYDALVLSDELLTLPHRDMQKRLFVLKPMAEIAPEALHPLLGKSVAELLDDLLKTEKDETLWISEI